MGGLRISAQADTGLDAVVAFHQCHLIDLERCVVERFSSVSAANGTPYALLHGLLDKFHMPIGK